MEWFALVFWITAGIMVLQTVISFFLGEVDFSLDTDLDLGDFLSFKGLLHFILGLSLVPTIAGALTFTTVGLGVAVGLGFVVFLRWLYITVFKALHQELNYENDLQNVDAEIYYWDNVAQRGQAFVTLEGRRTTIDIENLDEKIELKAGQKIKVSGTRTMVYKN